MIKNRNINYIDYTNGVLISGLLINLKQRLRVGSLFIVNDLVIFSSYYQFFI